MTDRHPDKRPVPVFGENGSVENAAQFTPFDPDAPAKENKLVWRGPLWMAGLVAWLMAGPLNPAGIMGFFMFDQEIEAALFLFALPSALGVGLMLWRNLGRPISLGRLFGSIMLWALATIPLYIALVSAYAMGGRGLQESIVMMFAKGFSGIFMGLFFGVTWGWYGVIFAIPAALCAIAMIRIVALRRRAQPEESN